ncbi:hypothetical protein SCATT_44940 [Streptantibioticus cattleyicolor NRRL 8057 = DSM 46488]|uniref:Uncharacterized protein n=1 Tax=Streptantibioticus cattleyicolor (strain ATCC 35852 / DSM 46488 / JCM 4925 / NBRC 14057 / NRRL 8057) TaxID=1003195 RepID=G8WXN5_STREN|nr:hypothetical protein SCATT_44940 [Streptantibioticus cattleyicolor NRRL 8057 = DSM 46488]
MGLLAVGLAGGRLLRRVRLVRRGRSLSRRRERRCGRLSLGNPGGGRCVVRCDGWLFPRGCPGWRRPEPRRGRGAGLLGGVLIVGVLRPRHGGHPMRRALPAISGRWAGTAAKGPAPPGKGPRGGAGIRSRHRRQRLAAGQPTCGER